MVKYVKHTWVFFWEVTKAAIRKANELHRTKCFRRWLASQIVKEICFCVTRSFIAMNVTHLGGCFVFQLQFACWFLPWAQSNYFEQFFYVMADSSCGNHFFYWFQVLIFNCGQVNVVNVSSDSVKYQRQWDMYFGYYFIFTFYNLKLFLLPKCRS